MTLINQPVKPPKALKSNRLHAIDPAMQDALIARLEKTLEQAREGSVTGYALIKLLKGGDFTMLSFFDRRLELLGALTAALFATMEDDR